MDRTLLEFISPLFVLEIHAKELKSGLRVIVNNGEFRVDGGIM